jgi:hypothetical protein
MSVIGEIAAATGPGDRMGLVGTCLHRRLMRMVKKLIVGVMAAGVLLVTPGLVGTAAASPLDITSCHDKTSDICPTWE